MSCPVTRVRCGQRHGVSLTHGALLVGEEDAAVAAVRVGHVDAVPVCPVEFPGGGRESQQSHSSPENFDLFSAHHNLPR